MSASESLGVACGAGMDIVLNYPPWVTLGAGKTSEDSS